MTFNPFHRKPKQTDWKKWMEKATIIPTSEGAWTRSPYGPRTLEENLRLVKRAERIWRPIDEA